MQAFVCVQASIHSLNASLNGTQSGVYAYVSIHTSVCVCVCNVWRFLAKMVFEPTYVCVLMLLLLCHTRKGNLLYKPVFTQAFLYPCMLLSLSSKRASRRYEGDHSKVCNVSPQIPRIPVFQRQEEASLTALPGESEGLMEKVRRMEGEGREGGRMKRRRKGVKRGRD